MNIVIIVSILLIIIISTGVGIVIKKSLEVKELLKPKLISKLVITTNYLGRVQHE